MFDNLSTQVAGGGFVTESRAVAQPNFRTNQCRGGKPVLLLTGLTWIIQSFIEEDQCLQQMSTTFPVPGEISDS